MAWNGLGGNFLFLRDPLGRAPVSRVLSDTTVWRYTYIYIYICRYTHIYTILSGIFLYTWAQQQQQHTPLKGWFHVGQGTRSGWGGDLSAGCHHPTNQSKLSLRGRCHNLCQEMVVPRHLGSPNLYHPFPHHKAPLTLLSIGWHQPRALWLQRAILRLHILSSDKDLRFIDQTIPLDPHIISWKSLTAPSMPRPQQTEIALTLGPDRKVQPLFLAHDSSERILRWYFSVPASVSANNFSPHYLDNM